MSDFWRLVLLSFCIMARLNLTTIDLTETQAFVQEIDNYVEALNQDISQDSLGELEVNIYRLANEVWQLKLLLNGNERLLAIEKDRLFTQLRKQMNSDLATTKAINTELRLEITEVELQKNLIEWINDKLWSARRYWDHANSMRIGMLADAKRL